MNYAKTIANNAVTLMLHKAINPHAIWLLNKIFRFYDKNYVIMYFTEDFLTENEKQYYRSKTFFRSAQ